MEYYLAIKRKEVPVHATIQMTLENIMLNKSSQTQKITFCVISFI